MRSNAEIEAYKRDAGLRMLAVSLELLFPDQVERQKHYKRIERAQGQAPKPKLLALSAAAGSEVHIG